MTAHTEESLRELIDKHMHKENQPPGFSQETVGALYAFGYGFYQNGKFDKSIHFFRFLTLIDMHTRKHWMGLGASYQMDKQYERALQCFGYAAILNPNDLYAHFYAAECFLSLNQKEEANKALNSAEKLGKHSPNDNASILSKIALMKPRRKSS